MIAVLYDRLSPPPTAPEYLVVSVDDLRQHLRIDSTDEDAVLGGFLRAAIATVDGPYGQLGRVIVPGTFALYSACPPSCLTLGPVQDVTGVARLVDGEYEEVEGSDWSWSLSTVPGVVASLFPIDTWPETASHDAAWRTTFQVGEAVLPPAIRAAILMRAAFFFGNRGESNAGGESAAIAALLAPYRRIAI